MNDPVDQNVQRHGETMVTSPIRYTVCGKPIPQQLSLSERYLFARKAGTARDNALFAVTHDRAATLVEQLGKLLESSNDAELTKQASRLISKWNDEANQFLASDGYGRP